MQASRPAADRWVVAVWATVLVVSCLASSYVGLADEARRGRTVPFAAVFATEATSYLVIAALIPAIYWMQRRFPVTEPRNLLMHAAALVPFSLAHTLGMAALRYLWFAAVLGEPFSFPLTPDRFAYEFSKDIIAYTTMNIGVMALDYIRQRLEKRARPAAPSGARPERFAVRKRGGSEIVVEVADIDWVEASGNYAILHVGGEIFEIRSSLAKLEAELDPNRFVRVHKSHIVNIGRVAEVTPWVSGDWRIRLQDGAELNLSRRYRQRFEALAPVRS